MIAEATTVPDETELKEEIVEETVMVTAEPELSATAAGVYVQGNAFAGFPWIKYVLLAMAALIVLAILLKILSGLYLRVRIKRTTGRCYGQAPGYRVSNSNRYR